MLLCDILIDDVTVLSPGEEQKPGQAIAVKGKKIAAVGPREKLIEMTASYLLVGVLLEMYLVLQLVFLKED